MRKILLIVALAASVASGANAQERQTYAVAHSGLTFGSQSGAAVGAELGTNVGAHLQVYGGGTYHKDLLPSSMREDLRVLDAIGINMRAPGLLISAGVRYLFPTGSRIKPYVGVGVGAARINLNVTVQSRDITDDLVGAGVLPAGSATELLTEFGGGVAMPVASALQFDLGYKFIKIRDEGSPNLSRLTVGFGARF